MLPWQLAQLNIARMAAPLDSPQLRDFTDNLERINALAESSPGFVWRLQDDAGDATALRPFGADILVNISVWRDVESLRAFAFRSDHATFLRRRREWFLPMPDAYTVLWWVPNGHRPSPEEAWQRLQYLRRHGPSAHAFGHREPFAVPSA